MVILNHISVPIVMTSTCCNCIIRPFDEYFLISKFFDTKCTHLLDRVHLKYTFSLKLTLEQIIFYLSFYY